MKGNLLPTSEEKKVNLGQQLIDAQLKHAGQTEKVRDMTNEMGKKYMESLWKVVEDHQHLKQDYYIMEIMRPDTFLEGVIKVKHIARRTRPLPEWGIGLYKVHAGSGTVTYEWGLPHAQEAIEILKNPETWDSKVVQDIYDYARGTLK